MVCMARAASMLALEALERGIADRLAAHLADPLQPPCIAKKHEEHRRIADPRHARKQFADGGTLLRIADAQNRRLLKIRFCGRAQGAGDQEVKQFLARRLVAVSANGLPRKNAAHEVIVFSTLARGAAIAKPARNGFRDRRHQHGLAPKIRPDLPAAQSSTLFRDFGQFIANSTQLKDFGIGTDLRRQSWPLRSPGILSRRVLRGFLPLRQRLSDQPSSRDAEP
jgi:hypothetical protein